MNATEYNQFGRFGAVADNSSTAATLKPAIASHDQLYKEYTSFTSAVIEARR
jgi:hypothetical protein